VLLECLTGERAFAGSPVESMMARLAKDPEVPAELGDSWAGLLRGMTNRAPDARPTARDVSGVLARLADTSEATLPYSPPDETVDEKTKVMTAAAAPRSTPPPVTRRRPSRRRMMLIGGIVAALLLAWPVSAAISSILPAPEPQVEVEYPVVDGTLGTHLEHLQRSVEP
jgi:hypothetical protein